MEKKSFSKSTMIFIGVIVVIVLWAISGYNSLVNMDEGVTTVKGYAKHEQQTLEAVMQARSQATQVKIDPSNCTPEQLAAYQKAQGDVTSALGKLLAITENYPDLKANQNFLELQSQLEGTENRITVARKDFNDAANVYNASIRRFPKNILAGIFGFEKHAYFEAEAGAEKSPKVEF